MRSVHIEHPHTYLWFVGVDPAAQGRGVGRALMADLHDWSDPSGLPVYLETGTRENAAFYASHGYARAGRDAPAERRRHVAHGAAGDRHGPGRLSHSRRAATGGADGR